MKTTDAIDELENDARKLGIGPVALLEQRAAAEGISWGRLLERLTSKISAGGRLRLLRESASRPQQLLEKAFETLGHSPAAAKTAAAGRTGRLREASAAKDAAGLGPDAYAYVGDPSDPTTWLLQIAKDDPRSDNGYSYDQELVKYAVNHLPGIAAYQQAVAIPDADLDGVKATLRSAWIAAGLSVEDLPIEMQQLELAASFRRLGVASTVGLRAALRGRSRR